jgi:hypothetical protein
MAYELDGLRARASIGWWDEWMEKYLGLGSGQYKYTIPCTDAYKI